MNIIAVIGCGRIANNAHFPALSELSDVTVKAPSCETYRVQEYHLPIYHYLCAEIEREFFGK